MSTCVDFSFEGLAPLWRTCMNASSSRSLQSVLVLLLAQRYRKIDVSSLYGLTTWQQKWNPYDLRIIPYHLQVTSFLSRSEWGILHWNAQGHKVPREKCHVSISPLEMYRKRNWLNRQSSRAQSGTQLLRTKRLHLLILDNLVTSKLVDYLEFHNRGAWCVTGTYDLLAHAETCGNVVQFSWLSDKQHNSNRWQTAGEPHPSQFSPCPKFTIKICRTLKFRTRLVLVHLALSCVHLSSSLSKYGKEMLRRSVEELMNQQLDDVWKLRFPEKMWHFVVFFTIWSIWQRHVMSLPGR